MRGRLIDRQANLVEAGNLDDSSAHVAVDVVEAEVRHNLAQDNHVIESEERFLIKQNSVKHWSSLPSSVLREIILVDDDFLIRRASLPLSRQRWTIFVAHKQIVVDEGSQRCRGSPRV